MNVNYSQLLRVQSIEKEYYEPYLYTSAQGNLNKNLSVVSLHSHSSIGEVSITL
jgi:hypothetical protein